ncbi:hypothetical protein [Streptomyces sp. bgisy031]|uniref:hypothetical protein n=1 Tax=Streptomyces sp. bgisy031 TaxID=3413772 RepID=UPI003D74B680
MASIETNPRKTADPSCAVVRRSGGSRTGDRCSEAFDDEARAERLRDLVDGHGRQRPPGVGQGAIANPHDLLQSIALSAVCCLLSAVDADPALRASHPCAHTRLPEAGGTEDDEVFLEPEEYALLKRRCASTRSTSLTASGALA